MAPISPRWSDMEAGEEEQAADQAAPIATPAPAAEDWNIGDMAVDKELPDFEVIDAEIAARTSAPPA